MILRSENAHKMAFYRLEIDRRATAHTRVEDILVDACP